MKNRFSFIVKFGRIIQKYYYHFSFLDKLFIKDQTDSVPVICIVAPPRSGSTLTYQILTDAIDNFHLTNFSNLLYATPSLAYKLQKRLCKNYATSFSSSHGFVPGLCGEAEGLKFWEYWLNQGLKENGNLDEVKLHQLHNRLKKVGNKPFITGYLGHPFSIEVLRKEFDKIIFIHLKRDILSNSYSLYKFYGDSVKMGSTSPLKCLTKKYDTKYNMVVDQILTIHQTIEDQKENDFIDIAYEELSKNPNETLKKIQKKAKELNIDIVLKKQFEPFTVSKVTQEANEHTKKLFDIITELKKNNEHN